MRALFGFVPFHAPTAPPYGLACLAAAIRDRGDAHDVRVADWNLGFHRRWLLEEWETLPCADDPTGLLARACPHLLVGDGKGAAIVDELRSEPIGEEGAHRYVWAAKAFEAYYGAAASLMTEILGPMVRARDWNHDTSASRLFAAELADVDRVDPALFGVSVLTEHNLLYALALTRAVKEPIARAQDRPRRRDDEPPTARGTALRMPVDRPRLLGRERGQRARATRRARVRRDIGGHRRGRAPRR